MAVETALEVERRICSVGLKNSTRHATRAV
jgi:hypothetical protein